MVNNPNPWDVNWYDGPSTPMTATEVQSSVNNSPSPPLSEVGSDSAAWVLYKKLVREELIKKEEEEAMAKNSSLVIVPYNQYSAGARAVANALNVRRRSYNETVVNVSNLLSAGKTPKLKVIVNWGRTNLSHHVFDQIGVKILNAPHLVELCSDKLKFFLLAKEKGVRIPEFTADHVEAMSWVESGIDVLGRKTRGSCGTDIVTFQENPVDFTESDFYVKYKKKKSEFRIHIFDGQVISEQQKVLRLTDNNNNPIDKTTVDFRIRNHRNGFIFQRNDIEVPGDVKEQALKAVAAVGLDFGAVDVIYNGHEGKAYVLEINTAPGLEGTTVSDYAKALEKYVA